MPVDARIPLGVQPPTFGRSILDFADKQRARKSEEEKSARLEKLTDLEFAKSQLELADSREKRRFNNLILDSVRLSDSLKAGDTESAKNILEQRKTSLLKLKEYDDTIDTTETDEALALLETDPSALLGNSERIVKLAEKMGKLPKADDISIIGENEAMVNSKGEVIFKNKKEVTSSSDIGQLRSDLKAGLITEEDFLRETTKENQGDLKTEAEIQQILRLEREKKEIESDSEGGRLKREKLEKEIENIEEQITERTEKRKEKEVKLKLNVEAARTKTEIVNTKIDEALALLEPTGLIDKAVSSILPGSSTTGLGGSLASNVPGTQAYKLEETVKTIKAILGFQELTSMREASPTGGALGQVSERELGFLQSVVTSLEIGQGAKILKKNLLQSKFDNTSDQIFIAYTLSLN